MSEFSPNHFIHYAHVTLDDADDLGGDVFVHVIGHGDAGVAVLDQFHGHVHALQEALGVDAAEHETAFVQGLGALGAGADAHRREGLADAGEEAAFLRQGAGIGHHAEGVHLQAVVVVEAEGLVADDTGVQLDPSAGLRIRRGSLQALTAAGVAGVQDGHIILLRHGVDGAKQREEVLFGVDVLFAVGGEQDVSPLLQAQAGVDVGGLDLLQVGVQDFGHRAAGHVGAFLGQAAFGEVAARVLAVGQVHVGDDVHDAAVGLLGQAFVLAAVAGFHVEDGDVQALGADDAQAGVGVAQDQYGIGLNLHHQFVTLCDDVAHRFAQVGAHGVQVNVRVGEFQVLEEHAVEVVVVVLAGVREQAVEVLPAPVDDRRQPDDFRPRADDDQEFDLAVILECCHMLTCCLFIGC